MIDYKRGFYVMTVIYLISILTMIFTLPDTNTVYGDKDCLQVLANREIQYQVDNSVYSKFFSKR